MKPPYRTTALVLALGTALFVGACKKKEEIKPPVVPAPSKSPAQPAPTPNPSPTPVEPPRKLSGPKPPPPGEALVPTSFADDAALIAALRAGGYVIALRHAHTDMTQQDNQGTNYEDCAKQRNLDDQGRADAKAIGAALKAMGVPLGDVFVSPFCRCKETAQLALGRVTVNNACMGEDAPSVTARGVLIATRPGKGLNTLIVTHRNSLAKNTGTELEAFAEGAALVIVPKGGSDFEVVHTITMDDWARLAAAAAAQKPK